VAGARLQADLADIAVQATFWTSLTFVAALSRIWPWWQHWYGRAMITIDILLVIAFAPAVVELFDPSLVPRSWFTWASLAAFTFIPARTAWLFWAIRRIQRGSAPTASG